MGVTYTPSWSSVNDYSFSVDGRPLKLQVIEATGATRTFSRHASNVAIKAYDEQGNEVHDTSADLAYEVWTVKTRLTPNSSLKIHAKHDNVWEDQTYDFSISTLYSDTTLKSAELAETSGKQSAVDCKIVTGSGVNKVRIEYEDGMTTTVNSSMAVLNETNMTYTYNLSVKPRHIGENSFKVYIKTPTDGWKYATTLTYTVE
ncbi:unknown [Ruminococcus sp. CAG:488]|nr:unknown [Ruminococcus sp. CAG:488]